MKLFEVRDVARRRAKVEEEAADSSAGFLTRRQWVAGAAGAAIGGTALVAEAALRPSSVSAQTSNFVDLVSNQTVGGIKTFTQPPVVPEGALPQAAVAGLVADLAAKAPMIAPGTYAEVPTPGTAAVAVVVTGDQTAAGNMRWTGAHTYERPAATGPAQADGPIVTFGGARRVAIAQQGTTDQSPGAGIVEVTDGAGLTVGPGSRLQMTWYQYGATLRTTGPKAEVVELWLGDESTINGPNLSVRHNGGYKGAIIQARDAGDFAGVMLSFLTKLRPRVMVEVSPNLPPGTVLGIENGNTGGRIAFATNSGSGITDRVTFLNDGKVRIGPAAPNQLVGVSGPAVGIAIQDTNPGGRSWELLSGKLGVGQFSIFDRAAGHRFCIDTNGNVVARAGRFDGTVGGVATQHVASATPKGGVSGDIKIGSGKIWVNDAGTWKSVAIS